MPFRGKRFGESRLQEMTLAGLAIRATLLKDMLRTRLSPHYNFSEMPFHRRGSFGETIPCAQALFEADQIDRVQSCAFGRALADEMATLTATSFIERHRQAFDLGPSVIAGGQVFSKDHPFFLGQHSVLRAALGPARHYDRLNIVSSYQGLKYFGHWLRDDCPLFEALHQEEDSCFLSLPDWSDRTLYEPAFGHQDHEVPFARVEALTLHSEQGFNLDKGRRIKRLRERLRAQHPPRSSGHIVYLSRGATPNPRDMANRAALEDAFEAAGIRVIHPSSDPAHLVHETMDARMIITVEGSQAAHGAYLLANGGAMLILQTPHRFYNPHHEWARLLGMHYGTVIGTPKGATYDIDAGEVFSMMDRLLKLQDSVSLNAVNEKTPPSRVSSPNATRRLKNK